MHTLAHAARAGQSHARGIVTQTRRPCGIIAASEICASAMNPDILCSRAGDIEEFATLRDTFEQA
ncbi:MAG: hypothetical protein JNJ60_11640 [Rhodocyclaceae bacterium]|nr:hypothetical protein [Rhodocyclaceae bacterium]